MVQNKPITGNGLFTFGSEYLKAESVPPNMLLAHAHNYYFNVAAEMGLLGLVGLIVLCIGFAVMVLKAWKSHQFLNKIEIAGLCGSLMGLAVHSLFETPQSMPLLMFLPGILIAQIASGVDSGKHKSTPWAGNGSLFVLWLTASILMGFDLRALTPYRTGLQLAKDEKLIKAETMVEEAINKDPNNALYWSQLGLISGQVAFKEKGDDHYRPVLEKAIEAYQKAVEIEPSYSVNWINLGILQWEGGYQDQAISSVNTAVEKSPKQAGFFLTLGRMYESVGNLSGAWNAYRQALKIDPYRLQSPFFDETEYRLSFSEYWEIRKHTTSDIDDKRLEEGWRLYNQGMYAQALELFQDTPGFNVPEVYLARGRAYSKLGNYQSAEKAYRTALWMRSDDGRLNVEVYLGLGELAAAEGNHVAAVEAFQKAADLMENTSSFGIGKLGESQYSWYIFYKPSLAEDLLTGVGKDPYTDEMINALHYIANWYYDSNQVDTAEESYLRILNLRPHDQVALERYNELKLRNE
jgi:tetratricopeptide (TPR) repeat protein